MWNKRDDDNLRPTTAVTPPASAEPRHEPYAIGASISIVGELRGDEDLTILGKVEGKVELPQHSVTIGRTARVNADIHAKIVSVEGEVKGNLLAAEQILIRKTATMLGNLTAPRVGLEDGCSFRGSVDMEAPDKSRTPPPPRSTAAPAPALAKPVPTPLSPGQGDRGVAARPDAPPARA
jgi:cytoskeletal protein CcmA (bactofilin family)